jgi:hypothetical protein
MHSLSTSRPRPPAALGIHGFSVVLVVGSLAATAGPPSNDGVPEAAKKALTDMKDFLPYKRYQLLDAAWMMCCASAHSGVSGAVRGPDDREFRYQVDPIGVSDTKLDVRFTIRELRDAASTNAGRTAMHPTEVEHSRRMADAVRQRQDAERDLQAARELQRKGLVGASDIAAKSVRSREAIQRVEELRRAGNAVAAQRTPAASGQNVIDSTFSITVGETVVVGTSRLNGDRALIAILTAAGKPTAPREP